MNDMLPIKQLASDGFPGRSARRPLGGQEAQ